MCYVILRVFLNNTNDILSRQQKNPEYLVKKTAVRKGDLDGVTYLSLRLHQTAILHDQMV